jgi:hypothetical protein
MPTPPSSPRLTLARLEAAEQRYEGPIPPAALRSRTDRALAADHHRAMIRFCESRLADYAEALTRLKAAPPTAVTAIWIASTVAILADHRAEKDRHERALAILLHHDDETARDRRPPLAAE